MSSDLPERLLRQLNPTNVRLYALQDGWKPVPGVQRPVIVLNHPTDDLAQLHIPTAGNDREYVHLMAEVVQSLAESEHRPLRDVLNDLMLPPADKLRLRVQSREAESGTLPLLEGLSLFQGGHDLLLASACSARQPQAYHPRQSYTEAQDFIRQCRFAQTEPGSYLATIITPVPPQLSNGLFKDPVDEEWTDEPYERRVTLMLMQSLQTIRGAIEQGNADAILRGVSLGISSNLCDALASMAPADSQAMLQIGMLWSRARPRIPKRILPQVSFAQSEFAIVREAGRRLRAKVEPHAERVEGAIISLQAEPKQLFEDFHGKVVIRTLIDGRPARVRFALKQADYAAACDAHRDMRHVAITGILQRDPEAKLFEIQHPKDFQVLATNGTSN